MKARFRPMTTARRMIWQRMLATANQWTGWLERKKDVDRVDACMLAGALHN